MLHSSPCQPPSPDTLYERVIRVSSSPTNSFSPVSWQREPTQVSKMTEEPKRECVTASRVSTFVLHLLSPSVSHPLRTAVSRSGFRASGGLFLAGGRISDGGGLSFVVLNFGQQTKSRVDGFYSPSVSRCVRRRTLLAISSQPGEHL